jgi:hypothetical protein
MCRCEPRRILGVRRSERHRTAEARDLPHGTRKELNMLVASTRVHATELRRQALVAQAIQEHWTAQLLRTAATTQETLELPTWLSGLSVLMRRLHDCQVRLMSLATIVVGLHPAEQSRHASSASFPHTRAS